MKNLNPSGNRVWISVTFLGTWLCAIQVSHLWAQSFATLHSFNSVDGDQPYSGLVLFNNLLCGVTAFGGDSGNGTVFSVNADGSGFTNLYSFTAFTDPGTNTDGANPYGALIVSGDTLYGTTMNGGLSGNGTVFAIKADGSGFTVVHRFSVVIGNFLGTNSDGANPSVALVSLGNTLYGTTQYGGTGGVGSVFSVNTDGSGFTNLHSFTGNGGLVPGALILAEGILYGTTTGYGISDRGTLFSMQTNGSGFLIRHRFDRGVGNPVSFGNNDGAAPASLILVSNTLYGAAPVGGVFSNGTLFAVQTDGSGFRTLHTFTATPGARANADGANPFGRMQFSNNTLYGTASKGGSSGGGTAFAVQTDGSGFTNLHSFASPDGVVPRGGLLLSNNTLYGTAVLGGGRNFGTVFSLTLPQPPLLSIIQSETNCILTWPATALGFILQSTTSLTPPDNWTTVFPDPIISNGQNTVTNAISDTLMFYRLTQ